MPTGRGSTIATNRVGFLFFRSKKRMKERSALSSPTLTVEYRPIASLRLSPKNPRAHSAKQIRQLASSIRSFGFNVPVLVDASSQVIAGHGRVRACKLLGIGEVPTVQLGHLSEHQIRAFTIADNRLTENAEWDDQLLGEQLKILSEAELDFTLESIGFEMAEIDLLIENLSPAPQRKGDPADIVPEALAGIQLSRTGDLWPLGRHRVYCGDSRNDCTYSRLMQGQRAEMVFTDLPDHDPIDGHVTGCSKIHHPEYAAASGKRSGSEFTDYLTGVFAQLARYSSDGALHYFCMDWRHLGELITAGRSIYTEFKSLCIWVREDARQGSLYRSQHELIFVFQEGKTPHRNDIQFGQSGRHRTNVWQYRRVNSFSRRTGEQGLSDLHPTVKPVELVADAILDCTARGDIVLDPFLGSGTTVIAAERTGRVCYGIALDPRDVDAIVRRWQAFTGRSAVQESTGRTFDELEKENHGRPE
jgi:hypothetical protein